MGMHKETPRSNESPKALKVSQYWWVMHNGAKDMDLIPCDNKEEGVQLSSLNWKLYLIWQHIISHA